MREPYTQLYIHLVWSTWDREPLITENIREQLYSAIAQKCRELKCEPYEIGGMDDHIHILVRLHTTVSVADLVKELKGATSHLVTHRLATSIGFKWQGAYGAFTIRKSEVLQVRQYIQNQASHHAEGTIDPIWERSETNEKE